MSTLNYRLIVHVVAWKTSLESNDGHNGCHDLSDHLMLHTQFQLQAVQEFFKINFRGAHQVAILDDFVCVETRSIHVY